MVTPHFITVHQCVFGYHDGHRLLAASIHLPPDTMSLLLLLSDLAPGVSFGRAEGYWTGIPLPRAKAYVLSRTWPATEMPRPGCVWTHSLLISFADVARILDLNYLGSLVVRPSQDSSLDCYGAPLVVDPKRLNAQRIRQDHEGFDNSDAIRLLRTVYAQPVRQGVIEAPLGTLDAALFALWSQQWPRLRRSFAFRTAGGIEGVSPNARFDLQIVAPKYPEAMSSQSRELVDSNLERWERLAVEDLHSVEPTKFRRFLWRYGTDIQRGRERFQTLAYLYAVTRVPRLSGDTLRTVLSNIMDVLPDQADGKTLKEDLVSCGHSTYSLFPPSDELDTISFLLHNQHPEALPLPPLKVLDSLHDHWEERSEQVLTIAEQAAAENIPLGIVIIDRVAKILNPPQFLALTRGHHRLREALVRANPSLVNSEALTREDPTEILALTRWLPDNETLIEVVLDRLVGVDSDPLAEGLFKRFPDPTLKAVVNALDRESKEKGITVPRAWLNLIVDNRRLFLSAGLINPVRAIRTLAVLASILGYDNPDVLQAGPRPWADALGIAQGQIKGTERQMFFAFLLALALYAPRAGSEALLQLTFEPVHRDLADGTFDNRAFSLLSCYLPNLHFWQQWDRCLRLRIAVVNAYVEHDLDPHTFPLLCKSVRLREDLMELARRTRRGTRFLEAISLT